MRENLDKAEKISTVSLEERDKLVKSASFQKLIEFMEAGNKLFLEKSKGEIVELTFNSEKELCYVTGSGPGRNIKLLGYFDNEDLTEDCKGALGEYLAGQLQRTPEMAPAISMVRLAASVGINNQIRPKPLYSRVINFNYDQMKDQEENARKIYIEISNHLYVKQLTHFLNSNTYEELQAEIEIPSDILFAEKVREKLALNADLRWRFEPGKRSGVCWLIVRRRKKW
ncbi:MAG: hypothetical protein ACRCZE_00850 [Candidatus Altimarinota bacterium]